MLDDDEDSPAPLRPTVPIGGVFPGTSPNTRPRDLAIDEDDEDIAEEEDARDEQIRPRALEAEWDFSDLLKDNVDVASCEGLESVLTFRYSKDIDWSGRQREEALYCCSASPAG